MSKFFEELMESVGQMDEILRGEREPSREFHVDALQVREIRKATGLSQAKFCGRDRCPSRYVAQLGAGASTAYRACQGVAQGHPSGSGACAYGFVGLIVAMC